MSQQKRGIQICYEQEKYQTGNSNKLNPLRKACLSFLLLLFHRRGGEQQVRGALVDVVTGAVTTLSSGHGGAKLDYRSTALVRLLRLVLIEIRCGCTQESILQRQLWKTQPAGSVRRGDLMKSSVTGSAGCRLPSSPAVQVGLLKVEF